MSQNYENQSVNSPISNTSAFQTNVIKVALYDVSTHTFVDMYRRFGVTRLFITLRIEALAS